MNDQFQQVWKTLQQQQRDMEQHHLLDLFATEPQRFEHYSLQQGNLLLDYSKNHVNQAILDQLVALAHAAHLPERIQQLFAGHPLNQSEGRPALHTALRDQTTATLTIDDHNIMPDIKHSLKQMASLSQQLQQQQWRGATGEAITDILHIGIGGSELGPKLLNSALKHYRVNKLKLHFLTSIDGSELSDCLDVLNPETTLVVIASKSFTTTETITNAKAIKQWLIHHINSAGIDAIYEQHLLAVTQNIELALAFGIKTNNIFSLWPWVGGRYSIWSAMALPIALLIGMDHFQAFLEGAYAMDQHFKTAPLEQNMPALLGLINIWYRNFFHTASQVILPYDHHLQLLPDYLQQLEMESNGKCWQQDGAEVNKATNAVLWGKSGLIGQHSFYQLLHQGTQMIPADFIVCVDSQHPYDHHHHLALANCFAQSQALMCGNEANTTLPDYRKIRGNRPSNTLVVDKLTPYSLGQLLALYEHKVFTKSVVWNINPFDQWSVELGKELAQDILPALHSGQSLNFDGSTNGLIEYCRAKSNAPYHKQSS